jgi:hypothetical protein
MKRTLFFLGLSLFLFVGIQGQTKQAKQVKQQELPGVAVHFSHPSTRIYLGSPSINMLEDGTYIASMDEFGPGVEKDKEPDTVLIFASYDKGKTWRQLTKLTGSYWSNLFVYKGALYLMGTSRSYGKMVIRKSEDGGKTWTTPVDENTGLLRDDEQYHTSSVPVVFHNGRIYRAYEDRNPPEEWGVNFRALVASAPLDSDLLKAASWTTSNRLRYYPEEWNKEMKGKAWLEGNVVVTPEGDIVNIMRNEINDYSEGKVCILNVSKYGETISFDPQTGIVPFSGGSTKFCIKYDSVSKKYWSLLNYVPRKFIGARYNPGGLRNNVGLISSSDLKTWQLERMVIENEDFEYVGFQYIDWIIDGNDIVSLMRTAFPSPDGTPANNFHDSNYMIFRRVENFRTNK